MADIYFLAISSSNKYYVFSIRKKKEIAASLSRPYFVETFSRRQKKCTKNIIFSGLKDVHRYLFG